MMRGATEPWRLMAQVLAEAPANGLTEDEVSGANPAYDYYGRVPRTGSSRAGGNLCAHVASMSRVAGERGWKPLEIRVNACHDMLATQTPATRC
jgi:hypothetical protein